MLEVDSLVPNNNSRKSIYYQLHVIIAILIDYKERVNGKEKEKTEYKDKQ
jgi:hypothetical protein